VRIKSIKAAHTVAVAPERVRQKHSSAEEPITARIRRRAESLPVSDRTTETDAGTATTPASHPVESVGRATAGDQSPVILADHASPTIDCSIRDEVSFQERVARSRREGNDYLATDIFERGMARSSGNDSQR